jgi:NADPH2:quinone reductase
MRAIRIDEFGGPEVLKVVDVPLPEPGDGEVLIRVSCAGLNFADTHQRHDQYVGGAELPMIPGQEVVGHREDTGERVIALCGKGGYAEFVTAPVDRVWPVADDIDDGTALGLLIQGLTAWHLHRTAAQLREGDTVVVHGAAGGTGQMILQLAKPMGAGRVIATASTEDKRKRALELGADIALHSDPEGLAERLTAANQDKPVDVVYDMAGAQTFDESFQALAPFGRIVAYGIATREQNEIRTGKLLRTSRSVVGFWFNHVFARPGWAEEALADLFARASRGELRVELGGTWPLAQAAEAQIALAERRTTGKLLLDVTT